VDELYELYEGDLTIFELLCLGVFTYYSYRMWDLFQYNREWDREKQAAIDGFIQAKKDIETGHC
jgi:hypothetical protein